MTALKSERRGEAEGRSVLKVLEEEA